MNIDFVEKIEEKCEINLDWFYHSTHYKKEDYKNILEDGIKCNYLLNKTWSGKYNGPFYISLSKITFLDNITFLNYACSNNPSFILEGIQPIKCERNVEYEKYINTRDRRRIGNFEGEYQYYYWIKRNYIKGILFNLYQYVHNFQNAKHKQIIYTEKILDLISLLEELDMDIPIYDYSRRDKVLVHKIDKEKLKYYSRDFLQ